jgi:hypothetical protein
MNSVECFSLSIVNYQFVSAADYSIRFRDCKSVSPPVVLAVNYPKKFEIFFRVEILRERILHFRWVEI